MLIQWLCFIVCSAHCPLLLESDGVTLRYEAYIKWACRCVNKILLGKSSQKNFPEKQSSHFCECLPLGWEAEWEVCLGDAVYGLGPLDADVGRGVAGRLWPEGANGAGHEDLEVVLLRELHHVVQPWKHKIHFQNYRDRLKDVTVLYWLYLFW